MESRNEEVWFNCHRNHKIREDKEMIDKCFNRIRENKRLNLGLDENHNTNHRDCTVYLNKLHLKKKRI